MPAEILLPGEQRRGGTHAVPVRQHHRQHRLVVAKPVHHGAGAQPAVPLPGGLACAPSSHQRPHPAVRLHRRGLRPGRLRHLGKRRWRGQQPSQLSFLLK